MLASALSLMMTPLCAIEICSKLALVAPWGARGAWGDERENAQATCRLASGALQISPQLHLGSCMSECVAFVLLDALGMRSESQVVNHNVTTFFRLTQST